MKKIWDLKAVDDWYADHFEELVGKFAGKAIAVIGGELVAVANTEKEADILARKKSSGTIPIVFSIPTREELVCLL